MICAGWDPDSYVAYNRATNRYEIDQVLVNDLNTNPFPLTDCDDARAQLVSGGYYELVHIGRDDLARHLGFVEHDVIRSINGYDLRLPQDYDNAMTDLRDDTSFTVVITRSGTTRTLRYDVR
jgi:hypothetical protein